MIRPIVVYGHPILKQQCENIDKSFPGLEQLVVDMWETMYHANGCGLAAPQIGQAIRLFVVDSKSTFENLEKADRQTYFDKDDQGIRETFINAEVVDRSDELWEEEEGCLSIPGLAEKVKRHWTITITWYDKDFKHQTRTFSGITARMIQHEYDHTKGILYLDHLKPLTKKIMASKLEKIVKGQITTEYPVKFV